MTAGVITPGTLLTSDGSKTLNNQTYGETYHSINGALTEARHVFLDASGVTNRLENRLATRVLEIGFGLGLNALLTADLAEKYNAELAYESYEHDLVPAKSIASLDYQTLLNKPHLVNTLLESIRARQPADSCIQCHFSDTISLSIHLKDVSRTRLLEKTGEAFHAIYLDAFSPDTNPECWSPVFFRQLANALTRGGCLSTYSAKGDVRRAMLAAGLRVDKRAGPPGKREMLIASKG